MVSTRLYRCNRCGGDCERGDQLENHVGRRHLKEDLNRWVAAESPERDLTLER